MSWTSPEGAYALKGNVAIPTEDTRTVAQIIDTAQQKEAVRGHAPGGQPLSWTAVLSTALTGGVAATALAVAAGLPGPLPAGQVSVISGGHIATFAASAAAAGATSITVTSQDPGFSFPIGSTVVYGSAAQGLAQTGALKANR